MPQRRTVDPTAEVVALFARGREIIADGDDKQWEERGGRRAEYLALSKRLDWQLLRRAPHEVSVLDDLSGDPPTYMLRRNLPSHPDFNGWNSGRELQQRLQVALDALRKPQ
jgi:hypothetical protein